MNKQLYQTPTTDVLVVRFEGVVCASYDKGSVSNPVMAEDGDIDETYSNSNWWN